MIKRLASLAALAAVAATTFTSDNAEACGGCFVAPSESTVVTGHRMALSISPSQSVLWDQIQYSGDPAEFSWVLPVKTGAIIEVAADAFFDVLDTATTTSVTAPAEGCRSSGSGSGFGCGDDDNVSAPSAAGFRGENNGVHIIHEGTVGPYDTVTLSAENPNALTDWLEENNYAVPDNIKPTIDAYVNEDFDFIALKLQPGQGVAQMKPVRVLTPGAGFSLPLRMVAAGVGANVDVVLFIITEGRYEAANFDNATIPASLVTWDFRTDQSDYAEQRLTAMAAADGRTWLTPYAQKGALLSPVYDPSVGFDTSYTVDNYVASTIAEAYYHQGVANGEGTTPAQECGDRANALGSSLAVVVDTCDAEGNCGDAGSEEIAAMAFECGELDDIAVALTGLHPADVHLTRLEAHLPVEALDQDLLVAASDDQAQVNNRFVAGLKVNACWDQTPATSPLFPRGPGNGNGSLPPEGLVLLTFGLAGVYLASRRWRLATTTR